VGKTKIFECNWCGYVLSVLAHGAKQVQDQLGNGEEIIKLQGCTFLLQVCTSHNTTLSGWSTLGSFAWP
jgi:hypothetical protein